MLPLFIRCVTLLLLFTFLVRAEIVHSDPCSNIFLSSKFNQVQSTEFTQYISEKLDKVVEFKFIRNLAKKKGIRVWLFGGTAASFLHYTKWDLVSQKGLIELQRDRFNYEFFNIFRSTQDIDIVVDASPEIAQEFQNILINRFPHFLGTEKKRWEVRTLRQRMGTPGSSDYKEALLDDFDFQFQNTDSNSVGMIEVTSSSGESVVRDLREWNGSKSIFLEDALKDRISFFRSNRHDETSRAQAGENPEILSALRVLVKAFQFDLTLDSKDWIQLQDIVDHFDPKEVTNLTAKKKIQDTSKKLILHSVNIEKAMNQLDQLGLRKKLISMGYIYNIESFAWWLNREPLRSMPVGEDHSGPTARELNIQVVSHETQNFFASEAITRSHSGEPNALISRSSFVGETALHGNGFYTTLGTVGSMGTGLTIRFSVDPNARNGSDFVFFPDQGIVLFKNKKALRQIPESLHLKIDDFLNFAESSQLVEVSHSDRRLLEMHKLRFNSALWMSEIDSLLHSRVLADFEKLIRILRALHSNRVSHLISKKVRETVMRNVFFEIQGWSSSQDVTQVEKYFRIVELANYFGVSSN